MTNPSTPEPSGPAEVTEPLPGQEDVPQVEPAASEPGPGELFPPEPDVIGTQEVPPAQPEGGEVPDPADTLVEPEVVQPEVVEPEVVGPGTVEDAAPTEILEAEVVEPDAVLGDDQDDPAAGDAPEPVETLILDDAVVEAPAGTDFTVADSPAAAAPPAPPAASPASAPDPFAPPIAAPPAGGSLLDLPPLPDLSAYAPATPPPTVAPPAPSYPQAASYPPAQSGAGRPQGGYAAGGYSEQSAAEAYGHGSTTGYGQPADSPYPSPSPYPQPAASPYTQPASSPYTAAPYAQPTPPPYAQPSPAGAPYGAPTGFGLAPYSSTAGDTTTASMAHWLPLAVGVATGGTLGFLAPLIIMLTKGQNDPLVRANAVEALNFNLTVLIGLIASVVLVLLFVGIIGLIVIPVVAIILQILGAIAASRGEVYRYPLNIRFVK